MRNDVERDDLFFVVIVVIDCEGNVDMDGKVVLIWEKDVCFFVWWRMLE